MTGLIAVALGGCGAPSEEADPGAASEDGWVRAPEPPLSPREGALGLWTGSETVVFGGSDAPPCPPTADCVTPEKPPLRDGAAFDPQTRTWRQLADAPHGFANAEGVLIDGIVYVSASGHPGRPGAGPVVLSYDIEADRWEELPRPGNRWASITATADRVVAFSEADGERPSPDYLLDPQSETWTALPDDPLPPSYDRTMSWTGDELVLLAKRSVFSPGAKEPSVALAAALDLDSGEWRRLPDSKSLDQFISTVRWFESDGVLINPAPGHSPDWGPEYGYGGVFDPDSAEWSELPEPPPGVSMSAGQYGAGLITDSEAHYYGAHGWILDVADDRWIEIPPLDDLVGYESATITEAGRDMLVFGGARFEPTTEGLPTSEGALTNEAWIWSPQR